MAVESVTTKVTGQNWVGRGAKGKAQNDQVFNSLDSKAKQSIQEAIGNHAYYSIDKIVANLKADGVTAVKGKGSNGEAYLEITNPDGSKSRIWDIGGDGGIGTQDLSFSNAISNVANDVAKNTTALTNNLVNNVEEKDNDLFSNTNKETNTFSNTKTSTSTTSAEDTALLEQIKEMLKKQGTADELLDSEAEKLLPYYKSVHIA